MSLLDYHGKNLLPTVWSTDGDVSRRFLLQLATQLKRFPTAREALLLGDTTSHYWRWDSDVDVMLRIPEEDLGEARQQAKRASGYPLEDTKNRVNFWPIPTTTVPAVLSKHFGSVYSLDTNYWYGRHVQDEMELRSADAVLQHANWRLYKAKFLDEPFPYEWRILAEAFALLSDDARLKVVDSLRYRIAHIDRNVTKLLKRQPRETWRAAEKFDEDLIENAEVPDEKERVPTRVVLALLHRFRYMDLLDTVIEIDDTIYKRMRRTAAPLKKPPREDTPSMAVLKKRFVQLSDMILQRQGGSAHAISGTYNLVRQLLEQNRYVQTDMRRRRIVYRLYQRFYTGKAEE